MEIIKYTGNEYMIQKYGDTHLITRVLKEFDDEDEAISKLCQLVDGRIKEEDL